MGDEGAGSWVVARLEKLNRLPGRHRDLRGSWGLNENARPLEKIARHAPVLRLRGREGADPNVLARALLAALNMLLPSDPDPTREGGQLAMTLTARRFVPKNRLNRRA
jgi:hypothetical protein